MADARKEYKINLDGCSYGHSNPALLEFLKEHPQYTYVKYPGIKPRLTGPSFTLSKGG